MPITIKRINTESSTQWGRCSSCARRDHEEVMRIVFGEEFPVFEVRLCDECQDELLVKLKEMNE